MLCKYLKKKDARKERSWRNKKKKKKCDTQDFPIERIKFQLRRYIVRVFQKNITNRICERDLF